jgi:acyl carrier protein
MVSDVHARLVKCFSAVFPQLPESEVPTATNASVAGWDSLATVTLLTVVEEEFNTTIEPEKLEYLQSFEAWERHLSGNSVTDERRAIYS